MINTRAVSSKVSLKSILNTEINTLNIEMLNKRLDVSVGKIQELQKQKNWVKEHQDELELNESAQKPYYERIRYWTRKNTGNSVNVTCKTCPNQTCHENSDVSNVSKCSVMRNGICKMCECPDWNHEHRNYVWKEEWKTVKRTKWELKKSDKQAEQNQFSFRDIIGWR